MILTDCVYTFPIHGFLFALFRIHVKVKTPLVDVQPHINIFCFDKQLSHTEEYRDIPYTISYRIRSKTTYILFLLIGLSLLTFLI